MRKVARLFSISWSSSLQYRGDIALWLVATTATPLLAMVIWFTVANTGGLGLTPRDMLTYYLLVMFIRVATSSWRGIYLIRQILNGDVINYIIRPSAIYGEFITNSITTKALQLLIPLPIFLAALILHPHWFSPSIYDTANFALFALSLLLAAILSFAFDISIGLLAFWLEDAQELMTYRFLFGQVASGILIPFAVMPPWLHQTFSFLPFRYIISAPAEILLGQVSGPAALHLLGYQLIWLLAFTLSLRFLYVRGLRRYAIPGQ